MEQIFVAILQVYNSAMVKNRNAGWWCNAVIVSGRGGGARNYGENMVGKTNKEPSVVLEK